MCELSVVAETSSWPWITGPSAVAGYAGSREGGSSDLHLLTVSLVAVVTAVVVCIHLWGSRWQLQLTLTPGAHGGSALPPVNAWRKKLLWQPCLDGGIISQCLCLQDHHNIHFKYLIILFVNCTLIKLKKLALYCKHFPTLYF